ncbi:MAG: ABC transporter ATP-binding protein [Clostridiales bacterium]|nr:ABC transporter ATP-binding protein [Clostridiales bacterium]
MGRIKTKCEKQFHKNNRMNFIMTIFSLILCSVMNIAMAFMLQFFIEAVEYNSYEVLKKGFTIGTTYLIIYAMFSFLQRNYKNAYIRKATSQFKDYIFEKMLSKSISQFGNGASAKFISAFSNDLASIETNYLAGTLNLILTVMFFVGAAIASLYIQWKLAIPILAVSLISIVISLKYGEKLVEKEKETSEENMDFVAQVKDLLNGFIVIKSFKAEKEVLQIFRKKNTKLEATKQGRRVTSDTVSIYSDISAIIVNIMIFALGFFLAFKNVMSIGMVIAFIQLGNFILHPVRYLAPQLSNRKAAIKLIERISDVIEKEEKKKEGSQLMNFEKDIVFRNLNFSYGEEQTVLENINLCFEKGKSYAIVGGSGSGKSTLFKLLLGHHTDYQGDLLIDGIPIKEIDLDSLYDQISIIQQDVFLFDSSIKDNITMFRSFDETKVMNAIEQAGLTSLIEEKGEDYSCGEGGKNLSGGEKQRVSIARCLVRGTPILLMDEATASLDNNIAQMVENKILSMENLTRIIVTHRFNEAIMRKYDEIFVMNRGSVIEQGTFDELMDKQGYFYSLYNVSQG